VLPSLDLRVVPDARNVSLSACVRGDEGPLSDGEGAGDFRALLVVFEAECPVDVLLVSAGTLHGSQDDSMLQIGGSNTDRLE
jgi:hypothetical protein